MNLYLQDIPASDLPPKAIQETPGPTKDPLIARGLQKEQYVSIAILALILIAAVGFFSRRVEYAIMFAFALSIVFIAFVLLI
ncbi:hypothetical protein [Nostoc sp. 106C]|uniref:hypothetical protein n=1 Tax=Nostoc sp. 106C TaxID=1932667 RepID=UPI000A392B96|nr:hypothetical protein [Nostoc sp. 106C]OUL19330.1 hypothetical protein BV375_32435 [Nostoc sp. 106C]